MSGTFTAIYRNGKNAIVITGLVLTLKAGPAICPKTLFLTLSVAPLVNVTQGSQLVFDNPGQN